MASALADMKAFYRWLDEATDEELEQRHKVVSEFSRRYQGRDIEDKAQYLLGRIEEEMLSRKINPSD